MDAFTSSYLANLSANLTAQVLNAIGRRLRQSWEGTEAEQALGRAVEAGVVSLLAQTSAVQPDELDLLADIFTRFLDDPDVAAELGGLLRGRPLEVDELAYLFTEAGYDAETLPGLDLEQAFGAFEAGFLLAATAEPLLRETVAAGQLLAQTSLQRDMLEALEKVVRLLAQAGDRPVEVRRGGVVAQYGSVAGGAGSVNVGGSVYGGITVSHPPHLAALQASGAATDHSVAGGPGSVNVGRDVHGDIYAGALPKDTAEALAIYRRVYANTCRHLPLRGIDVGASDPEAGGSRLSLDRVYIELNTTMQVSKKALAAGLEGDERSAPWPLAYEEEDGGRGRLPGGERDESTSLPALLAARFNPKLVLLGDPGSGKSTFLSHLGLCLAMHGLEPEGDWRQRLRGWPEAEAGLLPIAVTLRDFALAVPASKKAAAPKHLWDFILSRLQAQNLGFAADPLHQALEEGRAIVLLDGLDEIPRSADRSFVRDAVAAFMARYQASRFILTCRTLSYQDRAWQLEGVPAFMLAAFTDEQIGQFVEGWYTELQRLQAVTAAQAASLTRRLREALHRPDLRRLASNPLLLTVMALVHTHKGRLPDARALLYEETVEILLWRWDEIRQGETPPIRQLLQEVGRAEVDLKRVLWALAFEAHAQGGAGESEDLAGITEWRLQQALAAMHPQHPGGSRDWAHALIQAMKLRAGLLLERAPELYTFPHRTFQEFLAGCHLAAQGDFTRQAAGLVKDGPLWQQVILMAVGRLVAQGDTDKPLALAGELCPVRAATTDLGWRKAWLAGEVLVEMGVNRVQDSALGQDLLERVQQRLVGLLQAGVLTPIERVTASDVLAQIGDPRFRPNAWFLPDDPLLGLVEIPAGPFLMGGDRSKDERPQHQVHLPAFYVARYPVTVAQFRAFAQASGGQLRHSDRLRDPDSHPVRWVSWHEARAYCSWLTDTLRRWQHTPPALAHRLSQGWCFDLPSEAQWEKAARGDDGREFPWGSQPDPDRANYDRIGIGTTSAVGCFPSGASPYGCLDMAGNVREWTRSLWGKDWHTRTFRYPYDPEDGRDDVNTPSSAPRVIRGGAFYSDAERVRCAARYWRSPNSRGRGYGFRVVCAPSPSDL